MSRSIVWKHNCQENRMETIRECRPAAMAWSYHRGQCRRDQDYNTTRNFCTVYTRGWVAGWCARESRFMSSKWLNNILLAKVNLQRAGKFDYHLDPRLISKVNAWTWKKLARRWEVRRFKCDINRHGYADRFVTSCTGSYSFCGRNLRAR